MCISINVYIYIYTSGLHRDCAGLCKGYNNGYIDIG